MWHQIGKSKTYVKLWDVKKEKADFREKAVAPTGTKIFDWQLHLVSPINGIVHRNSKLYIYAK